MPISITLIGGPTALIEIDGFRLLTDPTFDAPGAYPAAACDAGEDDRPRTEAPTRSARSMRSCSATTSTRTISTIPAARF